VIEPTLLLRRTLRLFASALLGDKRLQHYLFSFFGVLDLFNIPFDGLGSLPSITTILMYMLHLYHFPLLTDSTTGW